MPDSKKPNRPVASVSKIAFSDGTEVRLAPNDIVLIVGPNNAGKSATLRAIRDKLSEPAAVSPVLAAIEVSKTGTAEELTTWIRGWAKQQPNNPQNELPAVFRLPGADG